MTKKIRQDQDVSLLNSILKGIEEKKGTDITILDLREIPNAICSHFILCNGSASTQVEAIADSVVEQVRKDVNEKPWHIEGFENKEWILIDFVNIVVHVFNPDVRDFYGLEELWADAKITHHETVV